MKPIELKFTISPRDLEFLGSAATRQPAVAVMGEASDAAEIIMRVALDRFFEGGKHLTVGTDGRFWNYDARLWGQVSDQWIEGRVLEAIEMKPVRTQQHTFSLVRQVRNLLHAKLACNEDQLTFLTEPAPVINCANGELWIGTDGAVELRPHRPESFLRHCLDVSYDPDATCPQYDRAVREIFSKTDDPNKMARHWNEVIGYLIQQRRNIPLVLVMHGRGNNGKTVLIQTVIRLIGAPWVLAQRVEELNKSRFAMGSLFGKQLFVDDDVRAGVRLPDDILKTISEAKIVTVELKFRDHFNFIVRAVPVLLCNNFPVLSDSSHGMLRRLTVIPFDRTFTDEEKDAELFERIWADELPGVLNRALAGLRRLRKRGSKFRPPDAVTRATEYWVQMASRRLD
jgi:putative DNA primase/helicase